MIKLVIILNKLRYLYHLIYLEYYLYVVLMLNNMYI